MSTSRAGLSSLVSKNLASARTIDKPVDTKWGPCSHTAISTVGYGEITPRSFLGRLVTLPLLLFGLLLIALPSFVLGREFSIVWNEMMSGHTPRTSYTQPRHDFTHSEVVCFGVLPTIAACSTKSSPFGI
jgi:hypothetical protein